MILAIAGADGVGKTTASHEVARALEDRGTPAMRLDRFDLLDRDLCPPAGFIDTDVHTLRQNTLDMSTSSRLFFYLWSMSMTLASERDEVVVYDSYWMKHTAAEVLYGADESAALAAAGLLPKADVTVYFDLSPELSLERIGDKLVPYECGLDPECRPESFLVHQRLLQAILSGWADRHGWIRVDASDSTESLVSQLVDIVGERL